MSVASFFARLRAPVIGGAGVDANREGGFVASHYRYFRNVRHMGAAAAYRAALELPAVYTKGREWYGPKGGAGAPFKHGGDVLRWIESTADAGLRFIGYADEIAGLRHTGWHCDDEGRETLRGAVWALPGRKGEARLVYGYQEWEGRGEMNEGSAAVCVSDIVRVPMRDEFGNLDETDGARDAARWADGLAESVAEDRRDYESLYRAGRAAAEADAEALEARGELLPLLAELRGLRRSPVAGNAPAVCKALRQRIDSLLETISEKRETRESAWGRVYRPDDVEAWRAGFIDESGFVRAVRLGYASRDDWRGNPGDNPCGPLPA